MIFVQCWLISVFTLFLCYLLFSNYGRFVRGVLVRAEVVGLKRTVFFAVLNHTIGVLMLCGLTVWLGYSVMIVWCVWWIAACAVVNRILGSDPTAFDA